MIKLVSLVVLVLLFILIAVILFYPDYDSPRLTRFLIIISLMFLLSIVIYFEGRRIDFDGQNRALFSVIILLAIAVRVVFLLGAEDKFYLTDEIYRYAWDGRVSSEGVNPYRYFPSDSDLVHLRDTAIYNNIESPGSRTHYLPVAQNFFLAAYKLGGGSLTAFKLMFALFEVAAFFLILKWMIMIGLKRGNLLLYMFSPLILVEVYVSAHLDILGIAFFAAALISMEKNQALLTGLLAACAALVKLYGLFFIPFIFLHFKGLQRGIFLAGFMIFSAFLSLPYLIGMDLAQFAALPNHLLDRHFYASVYDVLLQYLDLEITRYAIIGGFCLLALILLFIRANVYGKMFAIFGGYIVLTPAVFPWYLIWILPFITRNLSPAFWYLSGSILLSYGINIGDENPAPLGEGMGKEIYLWLITYIPFYVFLLTTAGKWLIKRIKSI